MQFRSFGNKYFLRIDRGEEILAALKKFCEDEKITLALGHILVSHHGRREFGSPVLPETPEAMIVNAADDLDFRLSYWKLQIDALNNQSDVTDYLPLIERRLWRGINL